jgi:Tfp pilus assembly pilus retraction ATPase PilT
MNYLILHINDGLKATKAVKLVIDMFRNFEVENITVSLAESFMKVAAIDL